MVVGSGIDVIAVADMQKELAHGAWTAADGIFRDSELARGQCGRTAARKLASYFVTKEAALKALQVNVTDLELFRDIEIIANYDHNIELRFHGRALQRYETLGVKRVLTALHADRYVATAMVILEA